MRHHPDLLKLIESYSTQQDALDYFEIVCGYARQQARDLLRDNHITFPKEII